MVRPIRTGSKKTGERHEYFPARTGLKHSIASGMELPA
jgi:hypothetical protein